MMRKRSKKKEIEVELRKRKKGKRKWIEEKYEREKKIMKRFDRKEKGDWRIKKEIEEYWKGKLGWERKKGWRRDERKRKRGSMGWNDIVKRIKKNSEWKGKKEEKKKKEKKKVNKNGDWIWNGRLRMRNKLRIRYGNEVMIDKMIVESKISLIEEEDGIGIKIKMRWEKMWMIGIGEISLRIFKLFIKDGKNLKGNNDLIDEDFDNIVKMWSDMMIKRIKLWNKKRNLRDFKREVRIKIIEMELKKRLLIEKVMDWGRRKYISNGWRLIVVFKRMWGLKNWMRGG